MHLFILTFWFQHDPLNKTLWYERSQKFHNKQLDRKCCLNSKKDPQSSSASVWSCSNWTKSIWQEAQLWESFSMDMWNVQFSLNSLSSKASKMCWEIIFPALDISKWPMTRCPQKGWTTVVHLELHHVGVFPGCILQWVVLTLPLADFKRLYY